MIHVFPRPLTYSCECGNVHLIRAVLVRGGVRSGGEVGKVRLARSPWDGLSIPVSCRCGRQAEVPVPR